jgi:hypothetical protein
VEGVDNPDKLAKGLDAVIFGAVSEPKLLNGFFPVGSEESSKDVLQLSVKLKRSEV